MPPDRSLNVARTVTRDVSQQLAEAINAQIITPQPVLVLQLPEPPALNVMLELARKRTRRGPGGAWMRLPQSRYWVAQQEYQLAARAALARAEMAARAAGLVLPPRPWARWQLVSAHFRLHMLRDEIELMAGLKWPVDALVQAGCVLDDSPGELATPQVPTQAIARRDRGVTLTIAPGWPATAAPSRSLVTIGAA